MHTTKKLLACLTAVLMCGAVAGCGKSADSSSSHVDQIEVELPPEDNENGLTISAIPEGEETELEWCSYFDLNPTGDGEKSTELSLFEQMGGSIKYIRTTDSAKYEKLASLLMANTPPDMFWYNQGLEFPSNCIKNMFQPIDEIVDFDSALWADVKDVAEQFSIGENHFVAPITFNFQGILTYDMDRIDDLGVDDPYELYLNDEWNWNTFEEIARAWSETSTADTPRIGLNGWFHNFIFSSTGETIVMYNPDTGLYENNLYSSNLERAANWLYDLSKDNIIDNVWYDNANDAFQAGYLFYSMGPWASTGSSGPDSTQAWSYVPIPKDPNADKYYYRLDTVAYMWVEGSKKSSAVKTWFECAKIAHTDSAYIEATKQKWLVDNPNWNEDMYELAYNPLNNDKITIINDPGYGISTVLSDQYTGYFDSVESIISYLYSSVSKQDENGVQITWSSLRDSYNNLVTTEIDKFNEQVKNYQVGAAYTDKDETEDIEAAGEQIAEAEEAAEAEAAE